MGKHIQPQKAPVQFETVSPIMCTGSNGSSSGLSYMIVTLERLGNLAKVKNLNLILFISKVHRAWTL
jgi:hypothetical protein